MDPSSEPPVKEIQTNCKHFVKRKKRYCKMTVKTGHEYCGEHLPNSEESNPNDKTLRIVCPLDNKHTCYAHKLAKHLKICNARPNHSLKYVSKGVNCGEIEPENSEVLNVRQLSSVKPEVITDLVKRINLLYEEIVSKEISNSILRNEVVEEEIRKPEYGDKSKKHLIQASSIVGHLKSNDLIGDDTCFIEFGAGKGQLSYWISQASKSRSNSSVLLVERASHRHKYDNKFDKSEVQVHRIKVDIADLVLGKVEAVEKSERIVGLTKHLCGDATDLTLRCLSKFEADGGEVAGVIMAFCCHHRCQWTAYTGKEFFKKHGLSRSDFDVMCGMVSWAICGSGQSRDNTKPRTTETDTNQRDKEIGLTRYEKEEVGKRCKHVLDFGRLEYIRSCGYKARLVYYVSPDVSPENVCVVAVK